MVNCENVNEERETVGMAVNPPSLLLKRCAEAKKMHGNNSETHYPTYRVTISEEMPPIVCDGLSGRTGSNCLGVSNDGNNDACWFRKEQNTGSDGQSKE